MFSSTGQLYTALWTALSKGNLVLLYNKFKQSCSWVDACLVLMIGLAIPFSPAVQADGGLSREAIQQWARASLARDYAWFNVPWTGNDQPYQNIRSEIDQALAKGQKPASVLQKYRTFAQQQPNSPQAIFGYGYAVYEAETLPKGLNEAEVFQDSCKVSELWMKVHGPHTYDYARLMFLHESLSSPTPDLIAVGKRLLARSPNDYEVEYGLATMASVSLKPTERAQALIYQQDLAQRFPNDPRQYRLLAEIYRGDAARTHSEAQAARSIAAYERYLALAPQFQAKTENDIRLMKELQVMWHNQ